MYNIVVLFLASFHRSFSKSLSSHNMLYSRSLSTQNLHASSSVQSPTKSSPVTNPTNTTKPVDCFVISNNSAAQETTNLHSLTNGSPTICTAMMGVARSLSDGKEFDAPTQGIRNAQSYDAFPTKRKHRKQGNRYKSCEIDYQVDTETFSDIDGIIVTPSTPVMKKKSSHRRQKSNANVKDIIAIESRNTDIGTYPSFELYFLFLCFSLSRPKSLLIFPKILFILRFSLHQPKPQQTIIS